MTGSGKDDVARAARGTPDAPAVETPLRRLTYRELDREVQRLAEALTRLREASTPAGTLALVLRDRFHTTLLLHASRRAGFTVAPLAPSLTAAEISSAMAALRPTAVLCDDSTEGPVRSARASPEPERVLRVDEMETLVRELEGRPATEGLEWRDGDLGPGYVVWTSGSSGSPRGVVLTRESLATVIDGSADRLQLTAADRWLATLSPSHVGGLATVLRSARLGSTLVVRDSFDAEELLDLASSQRVTHASLVPVMLRRVLAAGGDRTCPPALRCLLVGGAHAPPELVRRAVALGYPVALTYGMTETSSQAATAAPETVRRKPDTVGAPLPGVEIQIAADDEIRVRGPSLAAGCVQGRRPGPEDGSGPTTDGGFGVVPLELDEEGWYRTGDLGRWDGDDDLVVTGRRSSRIITGGVTVDPREVEEALLGLPEIAEAVVVGIADEEWGERVSAALVPVATEEPSGGFVRLVDREMRRRLSGPKRPRSIRVLQDLPRTPSGKVDREAIRQLLRESEDDSGESVP